MKLTRAGFTLVELCVVIGIAGVLTTLATLNFNQMQRKEATRNQVREMKVFVMDAQYVCMTQKKNCTLNISGNTMSATHFWNTSSATVTKSLRYPVLGGVSTIDTKGWQEGSYATDDQLFVCLDAPSDEVENVLIIEHVMTRAGKKPISAACAPANVTRL